MKAKLVSHKVRNSSKLLDERIQIKYHRELPNSALLFLEILEQKKVIMSHLQFGETIRSNPMFSL